MTNRWRARFGLTPREALVHRGYCTGSEDGVPVPGDVGLDLKAACCTCKRRVRVTARGRYAHHKASVESQRAAAEQLLPKLTREQLLGLGVAFANESWGRVHGHTIHSLERQHLIARSGTGRRITPLGVAVLEAKRVRDQTVPNIFDDLFVEKS